MTAISRYVLRLVTAERAILFWNFDQIDEDIFPPDLDGFVQSVRNGLIEALFECKTASTIERDLNEDTVIGAVDAEVVAVKRHLLNWMFRDDLEPAMFGCSENIHQSVLYDLSNLLVVFAGLSDNHLDPNEQHRISIKWARAFALTRLQTLRLM